MPSRRPIFALAAAALLVASVQAGGVGIFVDSREGAFLQTGEGLGGGKVLMCSMTPSGAVGAAGCAMDPATTAAAAAALMHAAPAAHIDASASAKVEALLAHDALSRPGAVLNVHLAGVSSDALPLPAPGASAATPLAGDLPHAVRHMHDCGATYDAVAALGCAVSTVAADLTADCDTAAGALDAELMTELAVAAGAAFTAEGFAFGGMTGEDGGGGAFTLPRAGGGAEMDGLLQELMCFLGNAKSAFSGEGAVSLGESGAAAGEVGARRLFNARLEKSAGVAESFGAGSREAAAAARLTVGAARVAVARAHSGRGGKVVSLVTLPDAAHVDAAAAARRRLLAADPGFPALTPSQKFRNMSVATVVALMIFVVAACGVLALVTMTFPSDSLLYPRDKND